VRGGGGRGGEGRRATHKNGDTGRAAAAGGPRPPPGGGGGGGGGPRGGGPRKKTPPPAPPPPPPPPPPSLKFTPIEDATLGFWLMAMDLRHVDHERFYTWAASCCFETLEHDDAEDGPARVKVGGAGGLRGSGPRWARGAAATPVWGPARRPKPRPPPPPQPAPPQVMDAVAEDLCSDTPWLVLHKIDSPTKMRALGAELRACGGGSVAAVAGEVEGVVGAVPAARARAAGRR